MSTLVAAGAAASPGGLAPWSAVIWAPFSQMLIERALPGRGIVDEVARLAPGLLLHPGAVGPGLVEIGLGRALVDGDPADAPGRRRGGLRGLVEEARGRP